MRRCRFLGSSDEHHRNGRSSQRRTEEPTGLKDARFLSGGSLIALSPVPTLLAFTDTCSAFFLSQDVALSHSSRCWYLGSV